MSAVGQTCGGVLRQWLLATFAIIAAAILLSAQQADAQAVYPPSDRPWDARDYLALANGVKSGQLPLPTLDDPATRDTFLRIIAQDNTFLWGARNKKLPNDTLIHEMTGAVKPLVSLMSAYTAKGASRRVELAKLQVYLLAIASEASSLLEGKVAKLQPDDITYEIRMAGYRQAKVGFRQMVTGAIVSIAETHIYSKESTLEMARGTQTYLPNLQSSLTPADRQYLGNSLQTQISATADEDIKLALIGLHSAIINGK